MDFLRRAASEHPGGFAAMGDDLEKFRAWPGTNKLCYTDGWLENLFCEFEKNADWLETSTPGNAVASHPSFGRADLPNGLLYGNDGVGAADPGARAFSRSD